MEDNSQIKPKDDKEEIIDVTKLSLDEWLNYLFTPPKGAIFNTYEFPTDEHLKEYLNTINTRSDKDVYKLLRRLLIKTGSLGIDKYSLAGLISAKKSYPELFDSMISSEYYRRLILYAKGFKHIPPWEGITWIFDLLPHFPKQAIDTIDAYILAHAQILPDARFNGLSEAVAVIRAKFIGMPNTKSDKINFLLELMPRDFEHLIERLYDSMEYDTKLTPPQKDGGRDIIACKNNPGKLEHLRIECKRYTNPVGIKIVRSLLGVVADEKVNKGVLITTSRFSKPSREFAKRNPRLELINGDELILLLNEHLGPSWPVHIDGLVTSSKRKEIRVEKSN